MSYVCLDNADDDSRHLEHPHHLFHADCQCSETERDLDTVPSSLRMRGEFYRSTGRSDITELSFNRHDEQAQFLVHMYATATRDDGTQFAGARFYEDRLL